MGFLFIPCSFGMGYKSNSAELNKPNIYSQTNRRDLIGCEAVVVYRD
jgi:hypothetical protein